MKKHPSIKDVKIDRLSEMFSKSIFWDVELDKFSLDNSGDRKFIIQRILKMSFLQDDLLDKLESIFSMEEIKYYAADSMEVLGNERIEMLCKRYRMQPSQFPHYIENIKKFMHA